MFCIYDMKTFTTKYAKNNKNNVVCWSHTSHTWYTFGFLY